MINLLDSHAVAKWFIFNNHSLANGYIDENTKLNKLLYFSNLMFFCVKNENMINENFVAFPNGPVIYSVYRDYRYKDLCLLPKNDDIIGIDDVQKQILRIVNFIYGNKSVRELVKESHSHNIYKEVEDKIPNNPEINFSDIDNKTKDYYNKMYNAYQNFDFSCMKTEIINDNVFYYKGFDLTDDYIRQLTFNERFDSPQFIEEIDGELVFS